MINTLLPYPLIKPLVFALDPECAHNATIRALQLAGRLHVPPAPQGKSVTVMGLHFPNRIGLAAGLDKNGVAIDGLAHWGFGFIEVGTVTPRPQPGNPKPRLFRLPEVGAIINRMGFNNDGIDALIRHIVKRRYRGVLGINLGKNADTPLENAAHDYCLGMDKAYPHADYLVINISSPNTKNLRQLQNAEALNNLLATLKKRQAALTDLHGRHVPLVLKIAPDNDAAALTAICNAVRQYRVDGLIVSNTTVARDGVPHVPHLEEAGGLSGAPLFARATEALRACATQLAGEVPLIAAGGVDSGAAARAKLAAGASLVQLYSGLVYHGPALVPACIQAVDAAT